MRFARPSALWLTLALSLYASASTPTSGTLSAPTTSGGSSSVSWSGGPFTAVTADTSLCTSRTCDKFTLVVGATNSFYASNPNYAVHVKINWQDSNNDFDLYVKDANGDVVCQSGQGGTTFEDAYCGRLDPGTYTVQVVAYTAVQTAYTGVATLAPDPVTPTGLARYRNANFKFSTPVQLTRVPDVENALSPSLVVTLD